MTKKIAVVTGAGSGIGRAIAAELAARDHTVVVTDLDLAAAEATAKELGGDATALALDVTDAAQAKSVAEDVVADGTAASTSGSPTPASPRCSGSSTSRRKTCAAPWPSTWRASSCAVRPPPG